MSDCIFCKLASGEIPTKLLYEDDVLVCFADTAPQAPVHVLFVSKQHIPSADAICPQNSYVVKAIFEAIPKVAKELGVENNYRLINNCGEGAGQSVQHLHFHLLSGAPTMKERLV